MKNPISRENFELKKGSSSLEYLEKASGKPLKKKGRKHRYTINVLIGRY